MMPMKLTYSLLITLGFLIILSGCPPYHHQARPYRPIAPRPVPIKQHSLADATPRSVGTVIPSKDHWHTPLPGVLELSELNRNIHAPSQVPLAHWGQMAHRVTKGDSLYKIATTYYGHAKYWQVIYQTNKADLPTDKQVKVGQLIYLPTYPGKNPTQPKHLPNYYIVNNGDTLHSIAKKITGDPSQYRKILNANRKQLPNASKLSSGTMLTIKP